MEIVQVSVHDLKEADYNPRKMTDKHVRDLTASIQEFGFVDPILVNKHPDRFNIVVGGHQRLRIARTLGFATIPVVYLHLDPKDERRLNLRLNKNNAEWDFETLANQFDIETLLDIGFEKADLSMFEPDDEEKGSDADNLARGDVFVLKGLRLKCWNVFSGEGSDDAERISVRKGLYLIFTDHKFAELEIEEGSLRKVLTRWAQLTGEDPKRESDGKPWSEIKKAVQLVGQTKSNELEQSKVE